MSTPIKPIGLIVPREFYNPLYQWRDTDEGVLKLIGKRIITGFAVLALPIASTAELIYHIVMSIFYTLKNSPVERNYHFRLIGYAFLMVPFSVIELLEKSISNIFRAQIGPPSPSTTAP